MNKLKKTTIVDIGRNRDNKRIKGGYSENITIILLVNSRSSSGANLYVRIFRQHLAGNKFNRSNSVTENANHCLVLMHVA